MNSTFLILMGGRNAIPALMGAKHFLPHYNRIKFLLCQSPDHRYMKLQKIIMDIIFGYKELSFIPKRDIRVVDGNDITHIYKILPEFLGNCEDLTHINLSSAPQQMAFAVYRYVIEQKSQALIFSVNTKSREITPLVPNEKPYSFNTGILLEEYIAACDLGIFKKKFSVDNLSCSSENLKSIVEYLVNNIKKLHPIIKLFRSNESLSMPNTMKLTQKSIRDYKIDSRDLMAVLTLFKQNRLVTRFEQKENGNFSYRIETKYDHKFLFGDWLEYYIWMQIKSLKFDDVQMSVELADVQGEIDVFCVYGANSILCECKTGKFDSKDMDRLQTKADKLGADYCSRILVTTQWKVDQEKHRQAEQHKIVLITGSQFGQICEIFSREMNNPTFHRR